jgi:hypothetical protein
MLLSSFPLISVCDQVLALTSYIDSGFQKRLKTGVVFVDLTAAYDTVWKDGLIHKLYNVIPCGKLVSLLEDMLSNRQFRVFVEDKSSKFRFLNNGLPQGSVLSPILFNLYTSDLPPTNSRKFIYADDLAMAYQHQNFENVENRLSEDLIPLNKYFTKWRLCSVYSLLAINSMVSNFWCSRTVSKVYSKLIDYYNNFYIDRS